VPWAPPPSTARAAVDGLVACSYELGRGLPQTADDVLRHPQASFLAEELRKVKAGLHISGWWEAISGDSPWHLCGFLGTAFQLEQVILVHQEKLEAVEEQLQQLEVWVGLARRPIAPPWVGGGGRVCGGWVCHAPLRLPGQTAETQDQRALAGCRPRDIIRSHPLGKGRGKGRDNAHLNTCTAYTTHATHTTSSFNLEPAAGATRCCLLASSVFTQT
jgi:hypothetical protein